MPATKPLQTAEITTSTGYTWRTSVSATATDTSLESYFVGQRVNIGEYDDLAEDEGEIMDVVVSARLVEGGES